MELCRTIKGDIDIKNLGHCQCHEHLFIKKRVPAKINNSLKIDDYQKTLNEVIDYKDNGGDSLVDAQPIGTGRIADWLFNVSKRTNVNIIASTGFHKFDFYKANHWIKNCPMKEYKDIINTEINIGMYEDDIKSDLLYEKKAGIIKTAFIIDKNVNRYKKLLKAASEAARDNGVPIMCHTDFGEDSVEATEIILSTKIPPSSVIICHLDRKLDNIALHKKVAEMGVFLDYDTIGRFKYHDDEKEIELIEEMINSGYLGNILLSLDTTRERLKSYNGDIGLSYILKRFIPKLIEQNIDRSQIKQMMIKNPKNALKIY